MCRREIGESEWKLTLGLLLGDVPIEVELCRSCIAEHAPELLVDIEQMGEGFSIERDDT